MVLVQFCVNIFLKIWIFGVVDEKSGTDAAFQDCFLVHQLVLRFNCLTITQSKLILRCHKTKKNIGIYSLGFIDENMVRRVRKTAIFAPKYAFLGTYRPCRLIWCPVGWLVGCCGGRAVSRLFPLWDLIYLWDLFLWLVRAGLEENILSQRPHLIHIPSRWMASMWLLIL